MTDLLKRVTKFHTHNFYHNNMGEKKKFQREYQLKENTFTESRCINKRA